MRAPIPFPDSPCVFVDNFDGCSRGGVAGLSFETFSAVIINFGRNRSPAKFQEIRIRRILSYRRSLTFWLVQVYRGAWPAIRFDR